MRRQQHEMPQTSRRLHRFLTLAGVLPFVACAVLPLFGIFSVPVLGSLDAVVASYGLGIACFVAGSHWGLDISGLNTSPVNLFASSNVIFLFVWLAYVSTNLSIAIAAQIIGFGALLFIDYRLHAAKVTTRGYFRLRAGVTVIVIVSLMVVLLAFSQAEL